MPLEALADTSRQRPVGSFDEFSAYPPIADYAFLSDCEVTALVAPSGAVEWMSLPRMDCPSIFGALLDRDAGWFRFGPEDMSVPADRRYLPGTMVCEPAADYGRQRGRWDHTGQGYHQAVIAPAGADLTLTLTSDIRIGLEG